MRGLRVGAPPRFHRLWNSFHATWNGLDNAPLVLPDKTLLAQWAACVQAARARLLAQDDLVTQILGFVQEKR